MAAADLLLKRMAAAFVRATISFWAVRALVLIYLRAAYNRLSTEELGLISAYRVCFAPKSGREVDMPKSLGAIFGLTRCNKRRTHSITSSASNCMEFGTSMPSAFAAFMLMTSSNLFDCMTGRSAGFSPLFSKRAKIVSWTTRPLLT
jgi:hypothetical protein